MITKNNKSASALKTFLLAEIIWLSVTPFAFGQKKIAPPPSKIVLPSDTSKVRHKQPEKLEAAKPDLELPDVMVYGTDRAMRTAGQKRVAQPEPVILLQPGSPYEPISTWFSRETEKPQLEGESRSIDRKTSVALSGGGYTTLLLDGVHFQKIQQGNYRLRAWMERSDGEFANSRYARGALSGKVGYVLSPKAMVLAHANLGLDSYGLHGAVHEDFGRRVLSGSLGGEVQYDIDRLADGKLGFELGGLSLDSDTTSESLSGTNDFWYKLDFGYVADLSGVRIGVYGDFLRETFSVKEDSVDTENSIAQIGIEGEKQFSRQFTASLGLKYQKAAFNLQEDKAVVAPYAKFNLMPGAHWGLSLKLYTGLEYQTYSNRWSMNRYLEHRVPFTPQNTKIGIESDIEFELFDGLRLRGTFSRRWLENAWYWQRNENTGLFELDCLDDIRFTKFELGVIAEISSKTRVQFALASYSDRLEDDDPLGTFGRFPYRPEMRIPARVSIQLLEDAYIELEADIVGKRPSRLDSLETLPSFGRMQAKLSKDFGKRFTALVIARNLLDADYAIWEGYPQMGVHVLFGVRARF